MLIGCPLAHQKWQYGYDANQQNQLGAQTGGAFGTHDTTTLKLRCALSVTKDGTSVNSKPKVELDALDVKDQQATSEGRSP